MHKPKILIVLDGWGHSEASEHNAILAARTPTWDKLWANYPHALLCGSGAEVGLPSGQMGNSEVGHMTIGSGRVIHQDLTRITQAVENGSFAANPALIKTCDDLAHRKKALHVLGLLSPGGIHSHEAHIHALIETAAARGVKHIYLHAFLDGRDMPPKSAAPSIKTVEAVFEKAGVGRIATLMGRFYAMDRDKRFDRTQAAYECIVSANAGHKSISASAALKNAYARDEHDEFVSPTLIGAPAPIEDGDVVMCMNFRSDRMRQLTRALVYDDQSFQDFTRDKHPAIHDVLTLTKYSDDLDTTILFPQQTHANTLGEVISIHQLKQLRIAETEKYAHVTFFFSGGREETYPGEVRELIPSPKVATYDECPEMSAEHLTDNIITVIKRQKIDVIVANFANPDMVGHTGNFKATVRAIETIDKCLARIVAALKEVGGEAIITADHGNAECMFNETSDQAHTAHTSEPVPFVYVGERMQCVRDTGTLADVAPTMLTLLDIDIPAEMTGTSMLS